MKKSSIIAVLTAAALSVSMFGSPAAAVSPEPPKPPVVSFTAPSCDSKDNKVTVAQHTTDNEYLKHYRFAIYVDGQPAKQLKTEFRNQLFAGNLTAEAVAGSAEAAAGLYGKTIKVVPYWLNKKDAPFKFPAGQRETVNFTAPGGGSLSNATKLSEGTSFVLVDPTTLNCQPAAPAKLTEAPDAPTFALSAARCENNALVPNAMTVKAASEDKHLRFVGIQGTKKISLNEGLRDKLWKNEKLTVQDIAAAYPSFVFDYSQPISVQPYWFDQEQAYVDTLYDTTVNLTVGDSDRFIKLGDPQTITLVDEATLNCAPKSAELPDAPEFNLVAAHCENKEIVPNHMTVKTAQNAPTDKLRFVAMQGDQKISLKKELRDKLWANGKLTQAELQTAYPAFKVDYTKPITVQAYFFDKDRDVQPDLYDMSLKLTVGKSDRFVKLGDAKTVTLVDPASLTCDEQAQQPGTHQDQQQGQQSGKETKTDGKTTVQPKKSGANPKLAKSGSTAETLMIISALVAAAGGASVITRARRQR